MEPISNDKLENYINQFNETLSEKDGQIIAEAFKIIAKGVIELMAFPANTLGAKDDEEIVKFLVLICFNRLHHYDSKKGKAFSYFTTVMLNYLRKEYQRWRKRTKLEQMYGRYIDGNTMEG